MIIAKIDERGFLDTVRNARIIAFQALEYGYAVAAPLVAFYAPLRHPGGGNLRQDEDESFMDQLGQAFLHRMSDPHARTLRPTSKPIPTEKLRSYLNAAFGVGPEAMMHYDKAPGDHPAVIESETQVVILAIEENAHPELKDAVSVVKREALSDALDLVIMHAESARELAEVGDYQPRQMQLHLRQSSTAMQSALLFLLQP